MKTLKFAAKPSGFEGMHSAPESDNFKRPGRVKAATRWTRLLSAWFVLFALTATAQAEDYTYTTNSGTITITGYTGPGGAVVIPDTINGLPVAEIGNAAFRNCTGVTGVAIPDSVIRIGAAAFQSCTSLTDVTIPDSVISLGNAAFSSCYGLSHATIGNGVTNIPLGTFMNCGSLSSVEIGNAVTVIESQAFLECSSLPTVTFPASVNNIEPFAFYNCTAIKQIYFKGDAPPDESAFGLVFNAAVFHLPGTTGWDATFAGFEVFPWDPVILSDDAGFGVGTDGFGFTIEMVPRLVWHGCYISVVKASTNLTCGEWIPLQTNTPALIYSISFNDPQWTNYPVRFYSLDMP
ncbi:leucine-rich repeat domain-containing protein [Pontiella sp.]|uniref:leucine-rich repeat domain-containing protein n=1 Tax=Pontiella sp. TaxID=2837462 RepID=UPI003567C175